MAWVHLRVGGHEAGWWENKLNGRAPTHQKWGAALRMRGRERRQRRGGVAWHGLGHRGVPQACTVSRGVGIVRGELQLTAGRARERGNS